MLLYSSTQNIHKTQHIVAKALGLPANKVLALIYVTRRLYANCIELVEVLAGKRLEIFPLVWLLLWLPITYKNLLDWY